MGMDVGGGKPKADMNVVPLIDIVLVLLIIFMVLTPMVQRGYDMSIPEKANIDPGQILPTSDQLIVTIAPDGRIKMNQEDATLDNLKTKIEDVLRGRREKMVFFQCDDAVVYQIAVSAMDAIRAGGGTIGLVTTDIKTAEAK